MENILIERIKKYHAETSQDYINVIREMVQEITLFALSKTNFFSKAAFLGGTALRIFYDLDRASEDLDFSLLNKDENFSLDYYLPYIEKELSSFGLIVTATSKKTIGAVQSAFVKGDTVTNLINIGFDEKLSNELKHVPDIRVKLEVDTNPPEGATYEYKYGLFPMPYRVLVYDESSLFAGKLHALICRNWVKGRDYYDYLFYLDRGTKPNINLLSNSLKQTSFISKENEYSSNTLKNDLLNKIKTVNFEEAKKDCRAFIKDEKKLDLWSNDFFEKITIDYLK